MNLSEIRAEHLDWKPDRRRESVLSDISVTFRRGEVCGILGPNGAGKTSLIRHILGLLPHRTGAVLYDGVPSEKLKRRELAAEIAFLPQIFSAEVDFTVYDIVAMSREPYRRPFASLSSRDREKIEEALRVTDCKAMEEKRFSDLSGGERQRVMIARTIAQDTAWIVLDEPVSSLDIRQQTEFMKVMRRLNREEGRTVLAILHDLNLAADFCSRLVLMKSGGIVADGSVGDVMTPENLRKTFDVEFRFLPADERQFPYVFPDDKIEKNDDESLKKMYDRR